MELCEDLQAQQNYDAALKTCHEADEVTSESSLSLLRYWVQKNLSETYYKQGELEKALIAAKRAARFASEAGDQQESANAYLRAAGLYEILGQWEDSETASNKALKIFEAINNKNGEAFADAELAEIYGDRNSSIRDFEKALVYNSAATQLNSGNSIFATELYLGTGNFSKAISASRTGIETCARVTAKAECQAGWLITLSEAQRKSGDVLSLGIGTEGKSSRLAANSKDIYLQGRLLYGKAGQARAEGHLEQAKKTYEKLISLIELVKGQGDVKSQRTLSENYGFIYDELSSTLYAMSAGKSDLERTRLASLALEYSETNKAREFASTWGRTFVTELRRTLPSDLQERERSLLSEHDKLLAVAEGEDSKSKLDSVNKGMASFVEGLRVTHPQYAAIAYPQPVTLDSLPLRMGETLVEFKVTEESTLVWVIRNVTGNKVELFDFYQVTKPRKWFEERVSKLRNALNSAQPEQIDWHNSEELFNELFPGSLSKTLLESKTLIFVPDDILSILPLELLSSEASKGHFPLLSIPTTYYPSAAALRLARTARQVEQWEKAFLGIGDPITSDEDERYALAGVLSAKRGALSASAVSSGESELSGTDLSKIKSRGYRFERIPGTAAEVNSIATLFENHGQTVEVRLGSDATRYRLTNTDLTRFRFLHFATHGILPVDSNIKEPALVLSFDGSVPEHMPLSMSDILGLKIHADTVVLSALQHRKWHREPCRRSNELRSGIHGLRCGERNGQPLAGFRRINSIAHGGILQEPYRGKVKSRGSFDCAVLPVCRQALHQPVLLGSIYLDW